MRRFVVVTPCLNAAALIDDTMASVLTQTGPFALRYHVQDGGSTDGTVERLRAWERCLAAGAPFGPQGGVVFSWDSSPDGGMYPALDHGFAAAGVADEDWMGWINASDRLAQGALATVCAVLDDLPEVRWLGGRSAYLTPAGVLMWIEDALAFPRRTISAGLHDGRRLRCVQQEGCLWAASLWRQAGGRVDGGLRLAGDFALWRRFAAHAELEIVNSLLGMFRYHAGQLSSDLATYQAEIDRTIADSAPEAEALWARYTALIKPKDYGGLAEEGFLGPVLQYDAARGVWQRLLRPPFSIR